jgi:bleomycin hydrolase
MGNQQSRELPIREKPQPPLGVSSSEKDAFQPANNSSAAPKLIREPSGLPIGTLSDWQSTLLKSPKNRLALTALSSANPREVLTSHPTEIADQQVYNVQIPFEGAPITDQRATGRCWLFASTNVFRVALMKRYHLAEFELSQAYLFFWDKLEKSNWFLEQVIDTAGEEMEGRVVQALMGDIASDGGQWDMVYNLVTKYGLVPQVLFPDGANAKNSRVLNSVVKTRLRECGIVLRDMCKKEGVTAQQLASAKDKMMQEIMLIMTLALGPPPNPTEEFTWQYLDKDGKARELTTTPIAFAKDIYSSDFRVSSSTIDGMISLVNDPRHDNLSLMTVDRLGNIVGGRNIEYVNVSMETMKKACIDMLKAGYPVFFGSDVGQFSDNKGGIMDLDLFDYELGFNVSLLEMSKAGRLMTGESRMTHAMVLTAVHVDEKTGKSVKWKVQNSWGTEAGEKGWFVMSDAVSHTATHIWGWFFYFLLKILLTIWQWMDEFVYQAVIDSRFLTKEVKDVLKKDPIVLPLWDPMGSLA